jgi:hypothetical protein
VVLSLGAGVPRDMPIDHPELVQPRVKLITDQALKLEKLSMIDFDDTTGVFLIKDVGRIAARYYIRHQSIEIFGTLFRPKMTEADILAMLSRSTEVQRFSQTLLGRILIMRSAVRPNSSQRIRGKGTRTVNEGGSL